MRIVSFPLASVLLALSFLLSISEASAQDSEKQELKAWKKKAKEYVKNPQKLKDDTESFQRQIATLRTDLESANTRLEQATADALTRENEKQRLAAEVRKLKEQVASQAQTLEAAQAQLKQQADQIATQPAELPDHKGVLFRVQIAAFAQDSLLPDGKPSLVERDQEMSKYVIASFRDYKKAKEFRDKLRRMGLRDAWIVAYRDGIRVPAESVHQPAAKAATPATTADESYPLEPEATRSSYEPEEIHN